MAKVNPLALVALLVAGYTAAALVAAKTFMVGDDQGWMTGVDYTNWISDKTFAVGDKLVFNYVTTEHTVTELSKDDYYACSLGPSNALSSDDSGLTNVTLTAPGTRYFVCNVSVHCTIGMKISVTVADRGGSGSPSGAAPTGAARGALAPAMGSVIAVATGALTKLALI